jgi:hypothetical protein
MKNLPTYLALFSSLVFSAVTPALAQQAGYPQGYEVPQSDAYRGQAQSAAGAGGDSSSWARQEAIQSGQVTGQDTPIAKPSGTLGRLGHAASHIGHMAARAAVPVAAMGGYYGMNYMVMRAATTAGINNSMMGGRGMMMPGSGYGYNPYGMGMGMGMPMGGMGMGMPMGGMGYGYPTMNPVSGIMNAMH